MFWLHTHYLLLVGTSFVLLDFASLPRRFKIASKEKSEYLLILSGFFFVYCDSFMYLIFSFVVWQKRKYEKQLSKCKVQDTRYKGQIQLADSHSFPLSILAIMKSQVYFLLANQFINPKCGWLATWIVVGRCCFQSWSFQVFFFSIYFIHCCCCCCHSSSFSFCLL